MAKKSVLKILSLLAAAATLVSCSESGQETAEEETQSITEAATTAYDWGTLAQEEYDDTEYSFAFSPYLITSGRNAALTETGFDSYCSLVDAICGHDSEVMVYSRDADAVMQTLCECFPQARLVYSFTFSYRAGFEPVPETEPVPVETDENGETAAAETEAAAVRTLPDEPDGIISMSYVYDRAEHAQILEKFYSGCTRVLGKLDINGYTDAAKALLLYSWTAQNVNDITCRRAHAFDTFSGINVTENENEDCYIAGGSQASVFTYLLLQSGVECTYVYGRIGNNDRMWTAVKLDGSWYHCDPALECTDTSGRGLMFFGMSDTDLTENGYGGDYMTKADTTDGIYYVSPRVEAAKGGYLELSCTKQSFTMLRDCDMAVFDGGCVTVYHRYSADSDTVALDRN